MEDFKNTLHYLDPKQINFDENNPRGETEKQIINDEEFKKLIESIKEFGIIEPLIVKPSLKDKFVLIDGERRLRASLQAKLKEIPVHIVKEDSDARILSYHVHMLRKDWSKITETKSIKRIIEDIKNESPNINERDLKKRIIEITRHKTHEIGDLLKIIKYDDGIIEKALSGILQPSYLVQIESNFINQINNNFPDLFDIISENEARTIMAKKAMNGLLIGTRYLMDVFKKVFDISDKNDKIKTLIISFLRNESISIDILVENIKKLRIIPKDENSLFIEEEKAIVIKKPLINTPTKTQKPNPNKEKTKSDEKDNFQYSAIRLSKSAQSLINDIRPKYESIANDFSTEEYEYIKEAIFCLENNCLKAAALMIWSAGISRILSFIAKDLPDYVKCSTEMANNPKSVYKHYCKTFQKNINSIEDILLSCKDIQLLSYLFFKNLIDEPQFTNLRHNLDTRNNCAHPTTIKLSANELIVIFENIHNLIYSNQGIK